MNYNLLQKYMDSYDSEPASAIDNINIPEFSA